jgi:hypothetical protein
MGQNLLFHLATKRYTLRVIKNIPNKYLWVHGSLGGCVGMCSGREGLIRPATTPKPLSTPSRWEGIAQPHAYVNIKVIYWLRFPPCVGVCRDV